MSLISLERAILLKWKRKKLVYRKYGVLKKFEGKNIEKSDMLSR
jgi:hypothetical protein